MQQARQRHSTVVGAAAVAAAICALFASGHPSGSPVADAVLRMAFAAVLVLLGAHARRWTWFVLVGGVAALSSNPLVLAACALLLVVCFNAALSAKRRLTHGSLITLVSSILLLRLSSRFPAALTAGVIAVACIPAIYSGYRVLPRARRRLVAGITEGVVAVLGIITLLVLLAAAQANTSVRRGVAHARAGLSAARAGDQAGSVDELRLAEERFASARSSLESWWAKPAQFLPFVGVQARAVSRASQAGRDLARAGADAASVTNYQLLRAGAGRIDLARLTSYQRPVADLAATITRVEKEVAHIDSPWLAGPLRTQIQSVQAQVATARQDANLASDVLQAAPELLGANGPRRYGLLFTNPAETRELGGYMGNFGELIATNGKLQLGRTGRGTDLLPGSPQQLIAQQLKDSGKLPTRYRYYDVAKYPGNVTGSLDFPLVARTWADLYPKAGGNPVDGVIVLDPYGLAALLRLTGPVAVEGVPEPLTASNAAQFLLKQQYVSFADRAVRGDVLDAAARATFDRLTSQRLPEPSKVAEALSPLVHQRRILAITFRGKDRELFDRIGLSGRIPPVDGGDYLSVTNANANPNKIDAYLERTISARARFDPNTGRTDSTVTVALHNTAPAADLPGGVTSGNVGLPPGTNRTFLSLYSPLALRDVQLDGARAGAEPQFENGRHRYGLFVDVPPGGTVKVQFDLRGTLRPSPQYRLTFLSQPVSNPDRLSLAVTGPSSATAQAGGAHGLRVTQQGDRAAVEAVLAGQTMHFSARFQS